MRVASNEVDTPAREDEDPHNAHLGSTFVPMPVNGVTEQEAIQQSHQRSYTWADTGLSLIIFQKTQSHISMVFGLVS